MASASPGSGALGRRFRSFTKGALVVAVGVATTGMAVACEPADCTTNLVAPGPTAAWDDPAAWDTGVVPGPSDIACIGAGWDVDLPTGGAVTVKGLKTASDLHLDQGSLTILNSQIQGAATAGFHLAGNASITLGGGTGNLTLDGGALTGAGHVYGTVSGAGLISPGDPAGTDLGTLTVHGDLAVDGTNIPVDVKPMGWDRVTVTGAFSATGGTAIDVRFASGMNLAGMLRTIPLITAASRTGDPQVYNVPDFGGTGKYVAVSLAGSQIALYVTDCDPWSFGPYTTYTSSLYAKDLRLCQLYTSSFAGVDLRYADLAESTLWDTSFAGANLSYANLARAEVGGADLSTATLTGLRSGGTQGTPVLPAGWAALGGYLIGPGADLTGADLRGLDLTGLDLRGAKLTGANLTGADLTGSQLSGVRSGGVVGSPALPAGWVTIAGFLMGPGADLTGADLTGLGLNGIDLSGATLTGAKLTGTTLTTATLTRVRSGGITGTPAGLPTGWQLRSGFLAGPGASFVGANLAGLDLTGLNLTGADFAGANLTGANLRLSNLNGVRSGGVIGTPLVNSGWVVTGGYLVGPSADLSGATLSAGASLAGLNLTGVNFTDATLINVSVAGSVWSNVTINGMRTRNLIGFPAVTPATMGVAGGVFLGPNVNLSGEAIAYVDLSTKAYSLAGANLSYAAIGSNNLTGLSLVNANLTGASIFDSRITSVNMTGADLGPLPVGATFGSNLALNAGEQFTPPAGWVLEGSGPLGLPPYKLRRVS